MIWNSESSKFSSCWNSTFLSVSYWIFSSASCYHLIQIQKMIPATFWNSVNLRPIWWQYFCHGHQLIELYCENWQSMLNFGGLDMPQHIGKLGSIRAIEPSNLVLKMVILMFSGSSHFCLPLHLSYQNICKIQYMC